MDFSKIKKICFILLILFILLFPFWCVKGFCSEDVTTDTVNSLAFDSHTNHFVSVSGRTVGYFQLEKGYIYTITQNYATTAFLGLSNSVPDNNVAVDFLGSITLNETYSYAVYDSNTYLCFAFSNAPGITVTREKIAGMNSTVDDLVSNVGISSIWNIFDISINYIVVVVLFAFGCYIIFRIIKKISRGKEGL